MFALCAIFMGMAAYLNSRIVERLGMRYLAYCIALVYCRHGVACFSSRHWASSKSGPLWCCKSLTMATFSLSVSNFGAWRWNRWIDRGNRRIAARLHLDIQRRVGGNSIGGNQRTTMPAGRRRPVLRVVSSDFVLLAEKRAPVRHIIRAAIRRSPQSAHIEDARPQ